MVHVQQLQLRAGHAGARLCHVLLWAASAAGGARPGPGPLRRAAARWLLLATVSIATTGIWVMHFVAMLGFTIPGQTITYNVPVTILSMVIAIVVVGIGLLIVGFGGSGPYPLLLGGIIIGFGVASMHYIGMAAMVMPDTMRYNYTLVALSIVIAVVAGTAALWAALRLSTVWSTLAASLIMGVAVSGMHYTGIAALHVYAVTRRTGQGCRAGWARRPSCCR